MLESGPAACGNVTLGGFPFLCDDGRFVLASNHGGAINEAFSDVFGTGVEFFFQEPGSGPLTADYAVAEDVPVLGPFRSLQSPQSLPIQGPILYPDHVGRRLRFPIIILEGTPASPTVVDIVPLVFLDDQGNFLFLGGTDAGGVHLNATILGHAFYLAIEGGRTRRRG